METCEQFYKKDEMRDGDLILVKGTGVVGSLIKGLTFGEFSHAAVVYDEHTIFETESKLAGGKGKAGFVSINKYKNHDYQVYRYNKMTHKKLERFHKACAKYHGFPYSNWDIVTNALFFWLADELRGKVVAGLGSKRYMRCGELTRRIYFESLPFKAWKDFEQGNPTDIYNHIKNHKNWDLVIDAK